MTPETETLVERQHRSYGDFVLLRHIELVEEHYELKIGNLTYGMKSVLRRSVKRGFSYRDYIRRNSVKRIFDDIERFYVRNFASADGIDKVYVHGVAEGHKTRGADIVNGFHFVNVNENFDRKVFVRQSDFRFAFDGIVKRARVDHIFRHDEVRPVNAAVHNPVSVEISNQTIDIEFFAEVGYEVRLAVPFRARREFVTDARFCEFFADGYRYRLRDFGKRKSKRYSACL